MIFTPSDTLSRARIPMMATINGTNGADSIQGTSADDFIFGLLGDDTLRGGGGLDVINGGGGNDVIYGGSKEDVLEGDIGDDTLFGFQGDDSLYGGDGNDTLRGGDDADYLNGGDGDDVFLVVGNENGLQREVDTYIGGLGNDTILGTIGDDIFRVTELTENAKFSSIETIDGGDGYDIISVAGDGTLDAKLLPLISIEELNGGNTNNTIFGTDDGIVIKGLDGDDTVFGGTGDDTVYGNKGNDSLDGGDGHDIAVYGGNRDDYTITEQPDGSLTVSHNGGGIDGVDTLVNIEQLSFADGIITPFGPTALDAKAMVEVNGSVTWKLSVSDATDAPDQLEYILVSTGAPANGSVTFDNLGNYTYTPNAGYAGSDSFTYEVKDSDGNTETATVSIDVVPGAGELQVNSETNGNQSDPVVAQLDGGRFVVVWHSNGSDPADNSDYGVYARIYEANGVPGTPFLVNTGFVNSTQWQPDVAAFSDGGFVVAWQTYGANSNASNRYAIHTQVYNDQGVAQGNPVEIFANANIQNRYPSITTLADSASSNPEYAVTWVAEKVSNGDERIYGVRVTPGSDPVADTIQVNTHNDDVETHASITALSNGGYVIIWQSYLHPNDGDAWGIFGQRYNSSGDKDGNEFHVNVGLTANQQKAPSVEALADGAFVVTYASAHSTANYYDVFIQLYDGQGERDGNAIRVNQYLSGRQHGPDVVKLADGDLLITWESEGQDGSDRGIYARRYDTDRGEFEGDEFQVHETTAGQQEVPSIAALDDGGFVITWRSDPDNDGNYEVHAKVFDAGSFDGTSGNDVLLGDLVDDTLSGLEGEDSLSGGQGNDSLLGGDDNDELTGGLGDDLLVGGDGADGFSFSLAADEGADNITDFSTSDGDTLAFADVVDTDSDLDIDINDAVETFTKVGNEITLGIVGGASIVVTDVDNSIADLNDLMAHVTINGI